MRRFAREMESVPDSGGAYGLVLRCDAERLRVRVGALGLIEFPAGHYCYVGSARAGLRARLMRHVRTGGKRTHWHIDYLRRRTRPVGLLVWAGKGADECALSRRVGRVADGNVPRFGCSDCGCESHLHYFAGEAAGRLRGLRGVRWIGLGL